MLKGVFFIKKYSNYYKCFYTGLASYFKNPFYFSLIARLKLIKNASQERLLSSSFIIKLFIKMLY